MSPSDIQTQALLCFEGCHDLMKLLGLHKMIHELKSRFNGLPVHKLCYYQSHHPIEESINQLRFIVSEDGAASLPNQDCLGMTPLHILACSTKQNLDLYQYIITILPDSLITEDKWGCIPLLYAIWSGVPQRFVQFLIDSHKSAFPNNVLDWDHMIETLCRAGVSLDVVQRLLDIQQTSYSGQNVNWQKAAKELTIRCLIECTDISFQYSMILPQASLRVGFFENWRAMIEALGTTSQGQSEELVQSLLEMQHISFADRGNTTPANLQVLCEEVVQPLKGWWRSSSAAESIATLLFLVKLNIVERLAAIGVKKWRKKMITLVAKIPSIDSRNFKGHVDIFHAKLIRYEGQYRQLNDTIFLLELALWKSKIDELQVGNADVRRQCRINCGADMIIPNVLPYLIGG